MTTRHVTATLVAAATILVTSLTIAAQDRATLEVPDGLALSEFKGYETWQTIAPSQTDEGLKVIVGNAVMMKAYSDGVPANGKPVPDGAMIAKIEWSKQSNPVSPYAVSVPDKLKSLSFMVKDSKRFGGTGGWGYAQFMNDPASNTLKPTGTGAACGATCHTRVQSRDYVFTNYGQR